VAEWHTRQSYGGCAVSLWTIDIVIQGHIPPERLLEMLDIRKENIKPEKQKPQCLADL
jgi:hypothetical protein